MAYKKPQNPLINNGFGIYPLTTADQVILSDGSRLEKNGQISIGGGTVKTVSGVAPDSAGDVALTAGDVGARPGDWTPTASDVGALEVGGTAVNAGKLDGKTWAQALDAIYPVGAVYISTTSTSPASLFGGTWESIGGRFLLGADAAYAAGRTGGEAAHKLTIGEMPSHTHDMPNPNWTSGEYTMTWPAWSCLYKATQQSTTITCAPGITQNRGDSQPHNNMPPYLAVYMWKRVS